MKTAKALIVVIATTVLVLTGCSGLSSKDPVPEPNPDHPPHATEADQICVEPYIQIVISVLNGAAAYAARDVLITVGAADAEGKPSMVMVDHKTGQQSAFIWAKRVKTSEIQSYRVCVEYPPNTVAYALVSATLTGNVGDSIDLEISTPRGQVLFSKDAMLPSFALIEKSDDTGAVVASLVQLF